MRHPAGGFSSRLAYAVVNGPFVAIVTEPALARTTAALDLTIAACSALATLLLETLDALATR